MADWRIVWKSCRSNPQSEMPDSIERRAATADPLVSTREAQMVRVTVLMLAFNHVHYVEQAVESVLDQDLDGTFDVSVLIGDDASSDGTPEIIERVAAANPGLIKAVLRPTNLGMFGNLADLWRAADGDYIAILESDDYWIRRDKLKRQIAEMEAHPAWTMSFHRSVMVDDHGNRGLGPFPRDSQLSNGVDAHALALENFVPTASVVYRRGVLDEIPAWLAPLRMLDWPIHLLHASRGSVGLVEMSASAYRIHAGGAWNGLMLRDRYAATAATADALLRHRAVPMVEKELRQVRCIANRALADELVRTGDRNGALVTLLKSLADEPLDPSHVRACLKGLLRVARR